jgi:cytochrome c553
MRKNKTNFLLLGLSILFLAFFATESLATQYARPVEDLQTGSWTSTEATLSDAVNEVSPADDTTYMQTSIDNDIALLRLEGDTPPLLTPDLSGGEPQILSIRAIKSFRPMRSSGSIRVVLYSGTTLVHDETIDLTTSWTTYDLTITGTIPDYSSLEVRLTSKGTTNAFSVSWVQFSIPDAPIGVLTLANPTDTGIGLDAATLGAEVITFGPPGDVDVRGVVWSTSANPDITTNDGSCTTTGTSTAGAFTCDTTNVLTPDTTYYFAGYATDSSGTTAYSGQGSFTTLAPPLLGHNYEAMPEMIDCNKCHALHRGVVPTGEDVFNFCTPTCHALGNPYNAPYNVANHVVTKESENTIDPQPKYIIDCGKCHNMHKDPPDSADPRNGGITAQNRAYVRVDMTKYISGAKSNTVFHNNNLGAPIPGDQVRTYSYGNDDPESLYNGACQSCHTDTKYHKNDGNGSGGIHKKEINCTNCHIHRDSKVADVTADNAFKGRGHAPGDTNIGISANCSNALGCHPTPIKDPVAEVHREKCYMCHVDPAGDGPLWPPWQAKLDAATTLPLTCENCHFPGANIAERATGHHTFSWNTAGSKQPLGEDGRAQKGMCITCHEPDVGQPGDTRADLAMPKNLPCNWCHLYWPGTGYTTDSSDRVIIYGLDFDPNPANAGNNFGSPAPSTALTTHTISKNLDPPISDYAACFACHGASTFIGSVGSSPQVVPFHGLGTPYSSSSTNDTPSGGTGGDIDDLINAYSGPQNTGTNQPVHDTPYHPGFNALNWLAEIAGWDANDRYRRYSNSRSWRRFHYQDYLANHLRADSLYYNTIVPFDIPWDSYDPNKISVPLAAPIQIDVNIGGVKGTQTIDATIPTLPLTLP